MSTITQRVRALLSEVEPFRRMSEEEREHLLRDITIEVYDAGQVVVGQGSTTKRGLFVLESGSVRLMDVDAGRLMKRCTDGDFFGAYGFLLNSGSPYEARAVETSVCAVLDGDRFSQLLSSDAGVRAYFERAVQRYTRRMGVYVDVGGAHLLFSRRLDELALRRPVLCAPDEAADVVARRMTDENAGSALVMRVNRIEGIVSDSDFRSRFAAQGLPSDTAIADLMTQPVATIPAEGSIFAAVMQMLDRRVGRLVVVQTEGERVVPTAILTDRDIAHFRGKDPLATVHRIDRLQSIEEIGSLREETNEQLQSLYEQGVVPEQLSRLMTSLYDRVTVRVIELVKRDLGREEDTVQWLWLRLGSGGRQEMVPESEQHHAVVLADDTREEDREYVYRLAAGVTEALAATGLSKSELVAGRSDLCAPLSLWKRRFREWILEADAERTAEALRFFDMRGIYGEHRLLRLLREDVVDALNVQEMETQPRFMRLMAGHMLRYRVPRNVFERYLRAAAFGRRLPFNLSDRGIRLTVEAARLLATDLRYFDSTNTFDRLRRAAEELPELREMIEAATDGYRQLIDFRLEHQLNQVEGGTPPDSEIELSSLSRTQQQLLRGASTSVASLQSALARRYGAKRRG